MVIALTFIYEFHVFAVVNLKVFAVARANCIPAPTFQKYPVAETSVRCGNKKALLQFYASSLNRKVYTWKSIKFLMKWPVWNACMDLQQSGASNASSGTWEREREWLKCVAVRNINCEGPRTQKQPWRLCHLTGSWQVPCMPVFLHVGPIDKLDWAESV